MKPTRQQNKQIGKFVALLFLILSTSLPTLANSTEATKNYNFHFAKFEGESLEYQIQADSPVEAYERAAQACFQHFKAGRHISIEYGQDIIDICANPRSH